MTHQEIIDYNKMCAEFLGAEIQDVLERIYIDKMKDDEMIFHNLSVTLQTYEWNGTTNIHYIPFDMLQFHLDWNWIKSVLEKISSLNEDDFSVETQQSFEDLLDLSLFSTQETVCESINNFLKTLI